MKRRELFPVVRYDSVIGKREIENDSILRDRRAFVWNAFDHGRWKSVASILIISAIGRLSRVLLSKISSRLRRESKLQFAGWRRRFSMPLFRLSFFVKQLRVMLMRGTLIISAHVLRVGAKQLQLCIALRPRLFPENYLLIPIFSGYRFTQQCPRAWIEWNVRTNNFKIHFLQRSSIQRSSSSKKHFARSKLRH